MFVLRDVIIAGTTPYLMHRFSDAATHSGSTRAALISSSTPREEAEKVAYIAKDGSFYFSSASIPRTMANAGASHKQRGTRKTLRFVVPSAVFCVSDMITLVDESGSPLHDFEVDSRPVTIPATKGRVMRHRPRFDTWFANFQLRINTTLLEEKIAQQLLTEAGYSVGIGDFRPEKSGPFGTFRIIRWERIDDAVKAAE